MVRQKDNVAVYKIVTEKRAYYVELFHLKNTYNGVARFEAHIIRTNIVEHYDYCGAHVYRFTGHCSSELDEAKFIVNYHERKIEKLYNN